MLSAMLILSSCLKDNDDNTVSYPSDAAIIAFSLDNLKRYQTTKAKNGSDSTYVTSVAGSGYKFYIDQINRQIYNPDSLPYGTDAKHVICSITSKNSGVITIKSLISDTLFYYNSSDSIDFSVPRTINVNSLDGSNRVSYTVTVNVHKEMPDSFLWHRTGSMEAFAQSKAMKAFPLNGRIYVFTGYEAEGAIYSCEESDNPEWQLELWNINTPVPENICENVAASDDKLYVNLSGDIYRSSDGSQWEQCGEMCPGRLFAATGTSLFALLPNGIARSDDEGTTWTTDLTDEYATLLPTAEIACCQIPSKVNDLVRNIILIGNRNASLYPYDTRAYVWNKVCDPDDVDDPWMYVSSDDTPYLQLPRLSSLSVIALGGSLIAAGGVGIGACDNAGFERFYQSDDGGIQWFNSEKYKLPANFASGNSFAMAADSHNRLWLICGDNGTVWRGRMSGDDGTQRQTSFTE